MVTRVPNEVLVVEDDRKTSELISLYLRRDGYTAVPAFSGLDALQLASVHRPFWPFST